MDDKLRKLERLVATSPEPSNKAALIAERVRLGRVTRQQVICAAVLGDEAALLLEPAGNGNWRTQTFHQVTQGEMLGYLAALPKEKCLEFVKECVEHSFMWVEYTVATSVIHAMGILRQADFSRSPEWLLQKEFELDEPVREARDQQLHVSASLLTAVAFVLAGIRHISVGGFGVKQGYRDMDNALSEVLDGTSLDRKEEAEFQRRLLISYLVGDR